MRNAVSNGTLQTDTLLSHWPEDLANALGLVGPVRMGHQSYALPTLIETAAPAPSPTWDTLHCDGVGGADGSILSGESVSTATGQATRGVPDMGFVKEVLIGTRHKVALAQRRFWEFALPKGVFLSPLQKEGLGKQALAAWPRLVQQPPSIHQSYKTRQLQYPPDSFDRHPRTQ